MKYILLTVIAIFVGFSFSCVMYLSRFLLEIALSGEKVGRGGGIESRKFTAKDLGQLGGRWSDQAGSLIKGIFKKRYFYLNNIRFVQI